ncbi:hypothetical protein KIY81_gp59 [Mycobacterium phage Bugsy]|uniref:Uncharacterized protein n=1 Tax=Mycobacterium phage Bugsy TaxID=2656567 RepID=A0A649VE14_9CAUD|nr:hypothetical protein KIY81_gp59 [Mycobacterium phage Bugsy]AMB18523.1 hypothetical protein NASIATALIE_33 [Mycobacterium phage NaSiaTalie]AYD86308.1 hypothetical protein SEA_FLARE16_33 [Mycobacterium phage Flare16]QGJ90557.1 hypothetical protein SEA_BUGSY_35 [Mycobacterium phage Bugsy]QXN74062.1 hypothetical protein SEA_MICULUCIGAS_33 [Mycobacterium Phage MiculUcigas]
MPDLTVPNPSALKAYVEDYERLRDGVGSTDTNLMLGLADAIVTEVRALGFPDLPPI